MLPDPLILKYLALGVIAIWGVLAMIKARRSLLALLLGTAIFLAIAWLALGTGFSIRIPYMHQKMEIITYTTYNNRVHALAHPQGRPGEPLHIIFSIDPDTNRGAKMRKSFFNAVRAREGKKHQTRIIINMSGYMTEQGVFKYKPAPPLPPKEQP